MFIFIIYTGWKNKVTTKQGLRNSEDPLSEFCYYNDKWDKKGVHGAQPTRILLSMFPFSLCLEFHYSFKKKII